MTDVVTLARVITRPLAAAVAAILMSTAVHAAVPHANLPSTAAGLTWQAAERISAPAVDTVALRSYEEQPKLGTPLRYGVVQSIGSQLIDAGVPRNGQWQALPDGRLAWRVEFASPDAVSLDAALSGDLPASAEIYLSNEAGDYVLGPIRAGDRSADGRIYTPIVPGAVTRLEVVVAAAERDALRLRLDSVTHAYRGLFGLENQPGVLSGSCNVDVTCPEGDGWQDQIDSVGQYIFQQGSSSYVCTGSLVATTAGTQVPYFLTANHCISTATVANTIRVYWNYQSATCRAPGSSASGQSLPRPATFSSGSTLKANSSASDFSLLELNAAIPDVEHPYYAGWDRRDQGAASAEGIHHPAGHEKRISHTAQALTITSYLSNTVTPTGTHLRVIQWASGTTEGGSSGSALFSPEKRIIGQLHGGYASCTSNTSDWYGRIATSWNGGGTDSTRLSNWLDPAGTGAETHDGYRGGATVDAIFADGFDE
ncbi:trypsin-like serine peptidase [Dokdonella sp. MW10]|uniref:trypsin-like serine peptidase n=1 Tax=Dokdonella sp. MW10 TaxID=2992926 RepID=UPI003F7E46B1